MKTAEEKAKEFCDRFTGLDGNFSACVVLLLKKQDLDTRHACAEAMYALDAHDAPCGDLGILLRDAHIACLNAKAC